MGKFKSKISTGLAALLSASALVFAGPVLSAHADNQLDVGGFKVTWTSPLEFPSTCTALEFKYLNSTGRQIFKAELVLEDYWGETVAENLVTGLGVSAEGKIKLNLCPSFLKMGLGPYKVTLYVIDNPQQSGSQAFKESADLKFEADAQTAPTAKWPFDERQPSDSGVQVGRAHVSANTLSYFFKPDSCRNLDISYSNRGAEAISSIQVRLTNKAGVEFTSREIKGLGSYSRGIWRVPICTQDILNDRFVIWITAPDWGDAVNQGTLSVYPISRPLPYVEAGQKITLTGEVRVGQTINISAVGWPTDSKFLTKFFRDGSEVQRSSGVGYVLTSRDVGTSFRAEGQVYREGSTSVNFKTDSIGPVQLGFIVLSPQPVIVGTVKIGKKLVVSTGTWDSGVKKNIQWLRAGKPIPGAKDLTYLVTSKDKGKQLSVRVTGDKDGYEPKTVLSAKTGKVG